MSKSLSLICTLGIFLFSQSVFADSLRCNGRLVDIGDTKTDLTSLCGLPPMTDAYCEPTTRSTRDSDGKEVILESCNDVEIWSYQPKSGGLWKHVYLSQGKVKNIRNGERLN